MNYDAQQVFDLFGELYPRELRHVLSELRARQAEQRLAELDQDEGLSVTPQDG